jgi:hypothetical protein
MTIEVCGPQVLVERVTGGGDGGSLDGLSVVKVFEVGRGEEGLAGYSFENGMLRPLF